MSFTSIEQSKHLLELGLKPETADMAFPCGCDIPEIKHSTVFFNEEKYDIFSLYYPCWSVGALLELIPLKIKTYSIVFCRNNNGTYFSSLDNVKNESVFYTDNLNLTETLLEIIYLLLENNYIKTE